MSETYQIEKGIPIPRIKYKQSPTNTRNAGGGRWQKIARAMDIGDSHKCDSECERRSFRRAMLGLGMEGVTRPEPGGGYRVWRTA